MNTHDKNPRAKRAARAVALWSLCLGGVGVAVASNAARQKAAEPVAPAASQKLADDGFRQSAHSSLMVRDVEEAPAKTASDTTAKAAAVSASIYRKKGSPHPAQSARVSRSTGQAKMTKEKGLNGITVYRVNQKTIAYLSAEKSGGQWRLSHDDH